MRSGCGPWKGTCRQQWTRPDSAVWTRRSLWAEPDEEHPLTVCGQTVLLSNASLANAIPVLPEQAREEILRYYFLHQSQRVIGACIGRSRSTAGRHIQIALRKLREEMERYRHE